MGTGKGFLLASVLLLPACSAGEDLADNSGDSVKNAGGSNAAGGFGGVVTGGGGVPMIVPPGAGGDFGAGGSNVINPGAGGDTTVNPGAGGDIGAGGMNAMGGMTGMTVDPPVQGAGGMGAAGAPSTGAATPIIPEVTAECPAFRDGTINFMNLGGIQVVAGPKAGSATAPMVFYWHGTGSTAGEFAFMAGAVRAGVVAEGGVLISFQGTTGGDLRSGTNIFGQGDYALVDQLVACAVRDHNVDPRRIFTTGCSAGGLFSAALAAERSNYIAAAAPNSGGWVLPTLQFQGSYTPALMTMHGAPGRDVVVVDFSQTSATADNAYKTRGGFVINCNHGGGHCAASGLAGDVWEFFKAHPYGVDPEPWAGGLPAGFNASCEIF